MTAPRTRIKTPTVVGTIMNLRRLLKQAEAAKERAEARVCDECNANRPEWCAQCRMRAREERDALKAEIVGLKDAERTFHRDAMREEQRARKAESDLARLRADANEALDYIKDGVEDLEAALAASGAEPCWCKHPEKDGQHSPNACIAYDPPAAPKCGGLSIKVEVDGHAEIRWKGPTVAHCAGCKGGGRE